MSVWRHRTVRFLIVVAVLAAGWQVYIAVGAARRLDTAVAADVERGGLVNIAVTLAFAPEDFHIRIFQAHGIVSGVKGTTVFLNRVKPEDVKQIARYYWIQRIQLQQGRG